MTVHSTIERKLREGLSPVHLLVENISHMHAVPPDAETHFDIIVVTKKFEGLRAVQCHQRVYQLLAEELNCGVHALAIHAFTPETWAVKGDIPAAPECLGGE